MNVEKITPYVEHPIPIKITTEKEAFEHESIRKALHILYMMYIYIHIKCMNVSFWIWGCLNIRGLSNSDLFREVVGYTCHLQAPEASMMHLTPKD